MILFLCWTLFECAIKFISNCLLIVISAPLLVLGLTEAITYFIGITYHYGRLDAFRSELKLGFCLVDVRRKALEIMSPSNKVA